VDVFTGSGVSFSTACYRGRTVFGFSFAELIVVVLVALVVMGPKDLPKMLRRVGQWAGKIRRAAADLRASSGIDEALRSEGLADDIAEIRKLARGELDAVQRMARVDDTSGQRRDNPAAQNYDRGDDFYVVRDREYPREGADGYGYGAIPDNAIFYTENAPKGPLARDPLYVAGDADAELPPEPVISTLPGVGQNDLDGPTAPTPDVTSAEPPAEPSGPPPAGGVGPTLIGGVGLTPTPIASAPPPAPVESDGPSSDEARS
jgi:sec-independent protein translocase protein TatB